MMSTHIRNRISITSALLAIAQPVFAQSGLDMQEADARGTAQEFISSAEDRFECEIEEYSMRELGSGTEIRYLFRLKVNGDECNDALKYLTNLAARDDELLFRKLDSVADSNRDPVILLGQELIHEVNPEIDDGETIVKD